LAKLADALEVSPDELKQYDTRGPIADLKRLMDSDPKLGFAFRTVVENVKNGELTAEDIIAKLSKRKSSSMFAVTPRAVKFLLCKLQKRKRWSGEVLTPSGR
jgi:hypothetical protein